MLIVGSSKPLAVEVTAGGERRRVSLVISILIVESLVVGGKSVAVGVVVCGNRMRISLVISKRRVGSLVVGGQVRSIHLNISL